LRKLLIKIFLPFVLGLMSTLLLNAGKVCLFDSKFHAETNWFLVGMVIFLIGGSTLSASNFSGSTGRNFMSNYLLKDKERDLLRKSDQERSISDLKTGYLWLGWGVIFIAAACFIT
jgi:hypothetical protein